MQRRSLSPSLRPMMTIPVALTIRPRVRGRGSSARPEEVMPEKIPEQAGGIVVRLPLDDLPDPERREPERPGEVGQEGRDRPVVGQEVTPARAEPVSGPPRTASDPGALPDEVDHPRLRDIPARPARAAGPAAEVHLLVVHEITFVEQADRLEDLAPDEEAGARDPVGRAGALGDGRGGDPPRQESGGQPEPQPPLQLAPDRVEAEGRALRRPVGLLEPGAGDPDLGARLHEFDERPQGPGPDDRVRVQQQDEAGRGGPSQGRPDRRVVAGGEPAVVRQRLNARPTFPAVLGDRGGEPPHRIVAGSAIDHDDPGLRQGAHLGLQRPEAVDRQAGGAVIDDDDQQGRRSATHPGPCLRGRDPARPDARPRSAARAAATRPSKRSSEGRIGAGGTPDPNGLAHLRKILAVRDNAGETSSGLVLEADRAGGRAGQTHLICKSLPVKDLGIVLPRTLNCNFLSYNNLRTWCVSPAFRPWYPQKEE